MYALQTTPPPPPDRDPTAGQVHWRSWQAQPVCTHLPPDCEVCPYAGPLSCATGLTWWARERRWLVTHYAVHCPRCRRLEVYRHGRAWELVRVPAMCRAAVTRWAVPETEENVLF